MQYPSWFLRDHPWILRTPLLGCPYMHTLTAAPHLLVLHTLLPKTFTPCSAIACFEHLANCLTKERQISVEDSMALYFYGQRAGSLAQSPRSGPACKVCSGCRFEGGPLQSAHLSSTRSATTGALAAPLPWPTAPVLAAGLVFLTWPSGSHSCTAHRVVKAVQRVLSTLV